jgi:hypothetical protein
MEVPFIDAAGHRDGPVVLVGLLLLLFLGCDDDGGGGQHGRAGEQFRAHPPSAASIALG